MTLPIPIFGWKLFLFAVIYAFWLAVIELTDYDIQRGSPFRGFFKNASYDPQYQINSFTVNPVAFIIGILIAKHYDIFYSQYNDGKRIYAEILNMIEDCYRYINAYLRKHVREGKRLFTVEELKHLQELKKLLLDLPSIIMLHFSKEENIVQCDKGICIIRKEYNLALDYLLGIDEKKIQCYDFQLIKGCFTTDLSKRLTSMNSLFQSRYPNLSWWAALAGGYLIFGSQIPLQWSYLGYFWGTLFSLACIIIFIWIIESPTIVHPIFSKDSIEYNAMEDETMDALKRMQTNDIVVNIGSKKAIRTREYE